MNVAATVEVAVAGAVLVEDGCETDARNRLADASCLAESHAEELRKSARGELDGVVAEGVNAGRVIDGSRLRDDTGE